MKFGLTQTFTCSYLPDQNEQLLVFAETDHNLRDCYGQLIQAGFRRSGEQIYRPHCPSCNACQSIRIPVAEFTPSRSQRRVLKKNATLITGFSTSPKNSYYPLYERYITARHSDGSMYPPSRDQYLSFIACSWSQPVFIEAYQGSDLVAVAVTDDIFHSDGSRSFSALYTFFEPELATSSMGTWMILQQIAFAAEQKRLYLYLGYQIDDCNKMNYKRKFFPHERLLDTKWQKIVSK
ncbi:arginyltransferase [Aestuariibacter sp. A3R04]|uniref:arginyltransferase n=1 Tax=Aestuariibacter sp. A3R04 TaxID=2841571 RepID=UPI001C091B09|nr:arginyltransferase [Aestuariibacter sp. A3R04]MBU3023081.1 arginyltransferase [Aestuariibacter sp. A3R04]